MFGAIANGQKTCTVTCNIAVLELKHILSQEFTNSVGCYFALYDFVADIVADGQIHLLRTTQITRFK